MIFAYNIIQINSNENGEQKLDTGKESLNNLVQVDNVELMVNNAGTISFKKISVSNHVDCCKIFIYQLRENSLFYSYYKL
jgi:hypothetical protein